VTAQQIPWYRIEDPEEREKAREEAWKRSEQQKVWRRDALVQAKTCGKCGQEIGDVVYRLRPGAPLGSYGNVPICENCAPEWNVKRYVMRYTRHEHTHEWPCASCGRAVVFVDSRKEPNRKRVFCSMLCKEQYDQSRRTRVGPRQRTCEVCGKEFTAARLDAKTCSSACRQKAYRERLRASAPTTSLRS
jgi:predicted nucleic acid-binding Zn ribbon protein